MLKNYGKIECFNDEEGIKHILSDKECNALCGVKFVPIRNYYGRKDYMLRRSIDAITCPICKDTYNKNKI